MGPRGLGSSGCWRAITVHLHILFTVEGRGFVVLGVGRGLLAWRWDRPGLAVSGEGIMVAAAVGAVGGRGWAAGGDRFLVSSFVAGWVLAAVSCPSMMKRAIGARGVFLFAALGGVAETVAVGALGVTVCLDHLLDLEAFLEEEEAGEEVFNVVGVNGDN